MKKHILASVTYRTIVRKVIIGGSAAAVSGLTLILAGQALAWQNPTQAPPNGNLAAPMRGSGTNNYLSKFSATSTLVNSLIFDNGTNVGIGTTNPGQTLHVNTNVLISPFTPGEAGTTYLTGTDSRLTILDGNIYDTTYGGITFGGMNVSGGVRYAATYNAINFGNGWLRIINNQQEKILVGGGDEWAKQDVIINPSGGNVGIGTTGPGYKLDVAGAVHAQMAPVGFTSWSGDVDAPYGIGLSAGGNNAGIMGRQRNSAWPTYTDMIFYVGNDGDERFQWYPGVWNGTGNNLGDVAMDLNAYSGQLYIKGNVGIGTTGPSSKLVVQDSFASGGILKLQNANGLANDTWWLGFTHGTNSADSNDRARIGVNILSGGAGRLVFYTGSPGSLSEKVRIDESGNVGIGTTGPEAKLQVVGSGGTGRSIMIDNREIKFRGDGVAHFSIYGPDTGKSYLTIQNTSASGAPGTGGADLLTITSGGNVGIGMTAPGYKLDVVSGGATTARFGTAGTDTVVVGGGTGKVTAGTVDPVYDIAGEKYATYLPGMTGQKEETAGNVNVKCQSSNDKCETEIDFANALKGSDLWLFSRVTDFGANWQNLTVLLTPSFDGRVWYQKDPVGKKLIIYGEQAGEVSYRFTAPRFDHEKWTNINSDEGAAGFQIVNPQF